MHRDAHGALQVVEDTVWTLAGTGRYAGLRAHAIWNDGGSTRSAFHLTVHGRSAGDVDGIARTYLSGTWKRLGFEHECQVSSSS